MTIQKKVGRRVVMIRGSLRTIHCRRCSKEIAVGEAVVSTRAKRRQNLYHINCAVAINLL
jgi:NAD-dependent SIR2 family protein deacetylase